MREVVIDTETTGLDPLNGDGVVEIEAVELINRSPQRADVSSLPMSATERLRSGVPRNAAGARFILAVVPSAGLTIARHGESVANSEDSLDHIAKTATSNFFAAPPRIEFGRGVKVLLSMPAKPGPYGCL
jgi:DNA polymerase III epsilon subunit-like protein